MDNLTAALLAVNKGAGIIPPQGVDFDGTYDYLSRSTDLTGNVDSSTFTFSAWVYLSSKLKDERCYLYVSGYSTNDMFWISKEASTNSNKIRVGAYGTSGDYIWDSTEAFAGYDTWVNIVVSGSGTSLKLSINDSVKSGSITTSTFSGSIQFTNTTHYINNSFGVPTKSLQGRLSHIFLDYTYRDLSIEANRRLFITADGKPANWATLVALNPILALRMKDAATAHINDGYGGNMVQNGTLDTAGRGANQDNCVASYFDGVADYLSRTSLTGIADGKQFVFSCELNTKNWNNTRVLTFANTGSNKLTITISTSGILEIRGFNSAGTLILSADSIDTITISKTVNISMSIDMTNTSSRVVKINNITIGMTWATYTNDTLMFLVNKYNISASATPSQYFNGNIGEFYFDTKYIDLATSNPFWDSVENKPVPVRKVIADTGVTPLIAMPISADNPGKNYGTGGDFTANSAPYVGARGASEYWQRTAKYDGSTSYFSRAGLLSITDANKLTFVANVYKTASVLYHLVGTTNSSVSISINASNQLVITAKNAAGTTILSATITTTIANTTWTEILVSIDLSNTANRSVYLNGVAASVTWTTYTNDSIDYTVASIIVGADIALANKFNGSMSLWLDNTYTDFTSEVNRNKYLDQLGYPKDLNSQVASGIIAKPALFLNSDNVSALGTNSGYGGDMTANGTIVSGADVLG